MQVLLIGLNHHKTPLAMRERFAVPARELSKAVAALRSDPQILEAVILSTCNRLEIYAVSSDVACSERNIVEFLSYTSHLNAKDFRSYLYSAADESAAAHLFRVASGLDSVILGESEIGAQVKDAYSIAHALGATGPVLNRLFQKALHAAKEIRSKTAIAQGHISIGSVAVSLARKIFPDGLSECEVLLWGAGKAAEISARHLSKAGVKRLWIVNRTQLKAQDLASLCKGGWVSWEKALEHLAHVDIAIVCTQAPHYVIDVADFEALRSQRGKRPLYLIDLAVPRNIDPALRDMPGLTLYNIDDLQSIIQMSLSQRAKEVDMSERLIEWQLRCWSGRGRFIQREEDKCEVVASLP